MDLVKIIWEIYDEIDIDKSTTRQTLVQRASWSLMNSNNLFSTCQMSCKRCTYLEKEKTLSYSSKGLILTMMASCPGLRRGKLWSLYTTGSATVSSISSKLHKTAINSKRRAEKCLRTLTRIKMGNYPLMNSNSLLSTFCKLQRV